MSRLIYSGHPIRTTPVFDDVLYHGHIDHGLPNGAIAAVLYYYWDIVIGIDLDADEWELITDDQLHEEMYGKGYTMSEPKTYAENYERGLFDG
jgi:hypothetical protein